MSAEVIDYATWGQRFFAVAVTPERVLAGVNVVAGRPIDVGPMGVGPGRLVKVTAKGSIGTATGERSGHDPLSFHVTLPVDLTFTIDLGMDKQRFDAAIDLPLLITAHARSDLAIEIDVTPPTTEQVSVRLQARGLRASLTGRAAGVGAWSKAGTSTGCAVGATSAGVDGAAVGQQPGIPSGQRPGLQREAGRPTAGRLSGHLPQRPPRVGPAAAGTLDQAQLCRRRALRAPCEQPPCS